MQKLFGNLLLAGGLVLLASPVSLAISGDFASLDEENFEPDCEKPSEQPASMLQTNEHEHVLTPAPSISPARTHDASASMMESHAKIQGNDGCRCQKSTLICDKKTWTNWAGKTFRDSWEDVRPALCDKDLQKQRKSFADLLDKVATLIEQWHPDLSKTQPMQDLKAEKAKYEALLVQKSLGDYNGTTLAVTKEQDGMNVGQRIFVKISEQISRAKEFIEFDNNKANLHSMKIVERATRAKALEDATTGIKLQATEDAMFSAHKDFVQEGESVPLELESLIRQTQERQMELLHLTDKLGQVESKTNDAVKKLEEALAKTQEVKDHILELKAIQETLGTEMISRMSSDGSKALQVVPSVVERLSQMETALKIDESTEQLKSLQDFAADTIRGIGYLELKSSDKNWERAMKEKFPGAFKK